MASDWVPAVIGLVGVGVGGVITGWVAIQSEERRARASAALDRAKRDDDRRIEAERFQRDTLLALQLALRAWGRTNGKMQHFDVMSLRNVGEMTAYPDDLEAEEQAAGLEVAYLTQRITDEALRTDLEAFRSFAAELMVRQVMTRRDATEESLMADAHEFARRLSASSGHLGEVLRRYLVTDGRAADT